VIVNKSTVPIGRATVRMIVLDGIVERQKLLVPKVNNDEAALERVAGLM